MDMLFQMKLEIEDTRETNKNFNMERTCKADEEQMHGENMLLKVLDLPL